MERSTFGAEQYLAAPAEWSWERSSQSAEQYLGAPWEWVRSTFGAKQYLVAVFPNFHGAAKNCSVNCKLNSTIRLASEFQNSKLSNSKFK